MLNVKEILEATNGELLNGNLDTTFNAYKIDSRIIEPGDFYIPLKGENSDGHLYIASAINNGAMGIFTSQDINIEEIDSKVAVIKVEDTLIALQEIGKYNRIKHSNIENVAITGSVGKTSTREMVASVLSTCKELMVTKKNFNGHIGLPLMALEMDNQDLAVFEAGIDFVGEMDILTSILLPDVAVVTNIGTSHIGKFGSQDIIAREKLCIAHGLKGKKILLLNYDDPYQREYKNDNIDIRYYSINDAKDIKVLDEKIEFSTYIYNKEEKVVVNALGNHNILNALVAIKIAEIYELPSEKIIEGVANYKNYSRRMEKITLGDITLIDDTYNASPSSTESGLRTINDLVYKRKIAVLADIVELGDYAKELHIELGKVFKDLKYDILITYGNDMTYLNEVAKEYVKETYHLKDAEEVKEKVKEIMQAGDIIYFKGSNAMKVNSIVESLKEDSMN